jgi:hypothetical protein
MYKDATCCILIQNDGKNLKEDVLSALQLLKKYPIQPMFCNCSTQFEEITINGLQIIPKKLVNSKNLEFWYEVDPRKVKVENE